MTYYADKLPSPFGMTYYVVDDEGTLVLLTIHPPTTTVPRATARGSFDEYLESSFDNLKWDKSKCSHVTRQLTEYYAGKRKKFDLKYRVQGTPFQMQVWDELTRIPYGKTATYGEIAERIGKPSAARAIGQANHNNSIMLVIPCHRCIGADGKVHGEKTPFSVRAHLLKHEGAM